MVKVKLLKPLNGAEVGSEAEYSEADCKMLEAKGAVRRIADEPEAKAEPEPKNKMEPAPKNKAAGRKTKG